VYDPGQNPTIDAVFNFGTFDYNVDNFYLKFVRGITDYQLGIDFSTDFFVHYQDDMKMPVWEQVLNLSQSQKQALFDALLVNYQEENRYYRYNFAFDNCATRPRDMVEKAVNFAVIYPNIPANQTFRQMIGECLGTDTWIKFGIDLVIGSPADKIATAHERMFLPLKYKAYLDGAKLSDGKPLLVSSKQVGFVPEEKQNSSFVSKPLFCTLLFFLLVVFLSFFTKMKKLLWLDVSLYVIYGLVGFLIFFLSFFSEHPFVSGNYNLLWLNPLYLVGVFLLCSRKQQKAAYYYQIFNLAAVAIALIGFPFLPQSFNIAFLPLMVVMLVRNLSFIRRYRMVEKRVK
jgi:hypothetical protein